MLRRRATSADPIMPVAPVTTMVRGAGAECGEFARAGWGESKVATGECVADADMVIEIREWRDQGWSCFWAFDDDRQPESQFAEPDGDRIAIDAEDRPREDIAPQLVLGARVAASLEDASDRFERVDEEGAGPAGWIEDAEGKEVRAGRVVEM